MWPSEGYQKANRAPQFCHPQLSLAEVIKPVITAVDEISGVALSEAPLRGTQLSFNVAAPTFAWWQYDKLNRSICSAHQTLSQVQLGSRPRPDDLLQLQSARSKISEATKLRDSMARYLEDFGYDLPQINDTSVRTQNVGDSRVTTNFSRPLPERPQSATVSSYRPAPPSLRIHTSPAPSIQMQQLHSAKGPGRSKSSNCSSPSSSMRSIFSIPENGSVSFSSASSTAPSLRLKNLAPYPWTMAPQPSPDYLSIRSGDSGFYGTSYTSSTTVSRAKLQKRSPSVASSKSVRLKDKLRAWSHLHRSHSAASDQRTHEGYWYGNELSDSHSESCSSDRSRTGTFYSDVHDLNAEKRKSKGRRLASQALWKMGSIRGHLRTEYG